MPHKCEGKAECGSCTIFVTARTQDAVQTQRLENDKLDTLVGVSSKFAFGLPGANWAPKT